MTWQLWVVVGLIVLGLVLQPVNVGKPREPRTPTEAVIASVINLVVIVLILWGAQ